MVETYRLGRTRGLGSLVLEGGTELGEYVAKGPLSLLGIGEGRQPSCAAMPQAIVEPDALDILLCADETKGIVLVSKGGMDV